MNKAEVTQIVKPLIEENKLKEALRTLSDYVKGNDSYLENDLLLQVSSFNGNEKDNLNGLITEDYYRRGQAKIRYNLTQIMEKLPEAGNEVTIETPNPNKARSSAPLQAEEANSKRKILFLAATPEDQVILNVGRELRKIKNELEKSTYRDKFDLKSETAVKISTITKAMLVEEPQIVHFSGHGSGEQGLVVEDDAGNVAFLPTQNVDELFELFKDTVNCVVLSACYSKEQAEVISKHGIYVIGMNDKMADSEAIKFSVGFYQTLGEGKDYEFAFKIARIQINDTDYTNIPELWYNGKKIYPKK